LKKFLREKTYFHFVFNNPLSNEFLHQVTLPTGDFLKTELVCFKELDLDLNDLRNGALNAKPFLTVTMFYRLAKESAIVVASGAFHAKDILKKEDEQYGITLPL